MASRDVESPNEADIERLICEQGGQLVLFVSDLSRLYGMTERRLDELFRRNLDRFPADFASERPRLAFTEAGVGMLTSVLDDPKDIQTTVVILRTFRELRRKIDDVFATVAEISDRDNVARLYTDWLREYLSRN